MFVLQTLLNSQPLASTKWNNIKLWTYSHRELIELYWGVNFMQQNHIQQKKL